jgi:general L-amino acid transport system substrate-binding protein
MKRILLRYLSPLLVILAVCIPFSNAGAGSVIERVKGAGIVRCGSVARPGLASATGQGHWSGLNVDICRAVAAALLESPERIEYHGYVTAKDFDAVRNRQDDIYFLTGSEINEQKLAGKVVPGPAVFVEADVVMAPTTSAARHVEELAGAGICFMIGSPAERGLEAYFDKLQKVWFRRAFSEYGEMNDAYNAQNCLAMAGELTTLASVRLDPGVNRLSSRILPESLTVFPMMVATGAEDAQWSAIVAWTIHTLVSAERPETRWYAGGAGAMPVEAKELGLDKGWQARVVKAVGNYGDIFERNLGKGSPLKLDRGFNANKILGGLLLSPFLE